MNSSAKILVLYLYPPQSVIVSLFFAHSNPSLSKQVSTFLEDCQFEPWSNWTPCSVTCGGAGIRTRSRSKISAVGDGKDCVGPVTEIHSCTSPPCVGECLTTDWTDFTPCSKSCGLGSQTRTRNFISQQDNCTDSLIEVRDCNVGCCSGN